MKFYSLMTLALLILAMVGGFEIKNRSGYFLKCESNLVTGSNSDVTPDTLLNHVFLNGSRVEVTTEGVTIWDDRNKVWILDASNIAETGSFEVNHKTKFPFHER